MADVIIPRTAEWSNPHNRLYSSKEVPVMVRGTRFDIWPMIPSRIIVVFRLNRVRPVEDALIRWAHRSSRRRGLTMVSHRTGNFGILDVFLMGELRYEP